MNAIEFSSVSKKFRLRRERFTSFRATVVDRLRGASNNDDFWALQDLTLEVPAGETLGIVGGNGSGKSTVLKLIAGILEPTHGEIRVRGSVSGLLELGTGFHADYTGRENIYLFGSFQGLGRREIDHRYDEIVAFSELGSFIDQPVKHYSSGMYLRLAFSAAIALDPSILLIDELLSVGDDHFQRKCLARLADLRSRGKTIVVVAHDLKRLKEICSRALWIQRGVCRADGNPDSVIDAYLSSVEQEERMTSGMDLTPFGMTMPGDMLVR